CERREGAEPREAFGVRRIPALLYKRSSRADSIVAKVHARKPKAPEYGALQTLRELACSAVFVPVFFAIAAMSEGALVPAKVKPAVRDRQDFQTPDFVHLGGWIGTRIEANEG